MTTEDKVNAIEHEIMMNEELISRDEVITLIACKHLSKEENFHGAITRLNRQVKALKPVTIKAELSKILDKISTDIDKAREDLDGYDPNSLGVFVSRVDEIIEKYKAESEE